MVCYLTPPLPSLLINKDNDYELRKKVVMEKYGEGKIERGGGDGVELCSHGKRRIDHVSIYQTYTRVSSPRAHKNPQKETDCFFFVQIEVYSFFFC